MSSKRALIVGVGGQDGSYLAETLLDLDYEVHGLHRHSSSNNLWRIEHIRHRIHLHRGDLLDYPSLKKAVVESDPHEIYNEADQDDANWSHDIPEYSTQVTYGGVCRLTYALRNGSGWRECKLFQPVSALMFGNPPESPQNENTPFNPQSPYASAKLASYELCRTLRREGLWVSTAIMYNHHSPRRSDEYVVGKICKSAFLIAKGRQQHLALGNLETRFDLGDARDYMRAAHMILQTDKPDDFVLSTGTAWSLREMCAQAFECVGIKKWERYVIQDPKFYRPEVPSVLVGDFSKANRTFGWFPAFGAMEVIQWMMRHYREMLK